MLEHERASETEDDAECHRDAESEEKDSNTVEEGENVYFLSMKLGKGFKHDDSDGIIEN